MELNWTKNSVMSDDAGETKFQITKTELYVQVVTLKIADNTKLNNLLETSFKSSVFWNGYKSTIETVTQAQSDKNFKIILLDFSFPGVSRLFVMGFNDNETNVFRVERNGHRKYFLTRVDIKGYNVLTDGRNFYDQPINDELKKYEALRKIMSGNEDYTTESSIH